MGEKYLIDTNAVIDFSENKLPKDAKGFVASIIDSTPYFSVINKIELLGFHNVKSEIIELLNAGVILGLTENVIDKTIALRRSYRIKLPDAVIAATAITHNLTLITNNLDDFKNIMELKVV